MRAPGTTLLILSVFTANSSAGEPTRNDLVKGIEKKIQSARDTAGPALACIVVSRSDRYHYQKAASPDQPGKLGGYSSAEFLKAHPLEDRLAVALDLSRPENIPDNGYACGVVIDPAGLILTPYHVVDGATKIFVYLPGRGGSYADIHAADARYDLAVLKLITPPSNLTAIKFADFHLTPVEGAPASLSAGKLVLLAVNAYTPGGTLDKPRFAQGWLTAITGSLGMEPRDSALKSSSYYYFGPFLEHDAKLNSGVSGAALLNMDGEMIGLTTSIASIGGGEKAPHFAFPADRNFRRIVEVLRRGEEVNAGYLGISLGQNPRNLLIDAVVPFGPAARADLESGDMIAEINGVRVQHYEELLYHIGAALADAKVRLLVTSRQRGEREVVVTLGKFSHSQTVIASVRPEPVFGLRVDYGSLLAQPLAGGRAPGYGVPAGVCVRELLPNSPAANAFKRLGDVPTRWLITRVNGNSVNTPTEFYKAAKGQPSVKLTVIAPDELNPKSREVSVP
jgi:serine protease Do